VTRTRTGLERLLARPALLRKLRVGLIANPTAVTPDLTHAAVALSKTRGIRLVTLFGPEHGIWADAQDLIEVDDSRDAKTGLPVFSLYGRTRVPTAEMLQGVDALVFDIQDVGSRYYTFIYTMLHAMEACAAHGKRFVVLDRPNPIDGSTLEGNVLAGAFRSFVGQHTLAVRHGMTVGELARMFQDELRLDLELHVVEMRNWRRRLPFEATGLPWVMPSPNMPTIDTAYVYPGGCLIEGTNLSEGRGTTRPFELVGAPWLDAWALADELNRERLPGVRFRAAYFTPTFHKHAGQLCAGVAVHVSDRRRFPAFLAYLLLIEKARRQEPRRFAWRQPPYEYEYVKPPIDILCGSDRVRLAIEKGEPVRRFVPQWREELRLFKRRRAKYLLYA
jgi:uncharacterized protein YbbC (DUF1343 family)